MSKETIIRKSNLNDVLYLEENLSQSDRNYLNNVYHFPNFMRLVECAATSFTISETDAQTLPNTPNEPSKVLGLAVFDIEPLNCSSQGTDIYPELQKSVPELTSFNSLFMSLFFVCNFTEDDYLFTFEELAKIVVSENPQIEAFIFRNEEDEETLSENPEFTKFLKNKRVWKTKDRFRVFYLKTITAKLLFRKAREEDQDNLSKISETQTHLLSEQYGQFFLAEIISSEGTDKVCLVAETEDKKAVGLAVVSSDVNFELIAGNFDLKEYNFFTKSDYFAAFEHKKSQLQKIEFLQNKMLQQKYAEELEYHRATCSKNWLTLDLQDYCSANKNAILGEFQQILGDVEKQKLINKNLMKRKLEKLLKNHTIVKPNEVWAKELDASVSTCIMSASDLLLETLRFFDLSANYLDGDGHWSFWIKRKQDEKNEEAKQKGILGKKKNKTKKKKVEDGKDNQLVTPPWFDVEPFFIALQFYINANQSVRRHICQAIENLKSKIAVLFYAENGELKSERVVDLNDVLELIAAEEIGTLPENLQALISYVLVCFGNLQFDLEKLVLTESTKGKSGKVKEKIKDHILRKISFNELFAAIERIKKIDYFFAKKSAYIKEIEAKINEQFQASALKIINSSSQNFECSKYFDHPISFDLMTKNSLNFSLTNIPKEVKNAVCCNVFFIDQSFEQSSGEFLQSIFEFFEQFDYFILTLPHKTPEFKLLQGFIKAKKLEHSNFPHSLYVFYKANLLNKFATVEIKETKELNLLNSIKSNGSAHKTTQFEFNITLKIPNFPVTQIGNVICQKAFNMNHLKQFFDVSELLYLEGYNKTELLEITHFELHFVFKKLNSFILREILRLTNSKILVRSQGNSQLSLLSEYFCYIKSLSEFKLLLNKNSSVFRNNKIENRFAVEFESQNNSTKKEALKNNETHNCQLPVNLSLATLKMLSNEREKVTSRVIVIGASSCGLSFLESLLNHPNFNFVSVCLISESVDWEAQIIQTKPLKLERLDSPVTASSLLERVSVILGQVFFLDRKIKTVSVKTTSGRQFSLEYDFLIFANGLEEKTFENIIDKKPTDEKVRKPQNIIAIDKLNFSLCEAICSDQNLSLFSYLRLNKLAKEDNDESKHSGIFPDTSNQLNLKDPKNPVSLARPSFLREYTHIQSILETDDKIIDEFKQRQHVFSKIIANKTIHPIILYGFSIEILIVLEQLVNRWGVKPENLLLIIPRDLDLYDKEVTSNWGSTNDSKLDFVEKLTESPVGLNCKRVREFYFELLKKENISIYQNFEISDFSMQENTVTLKNLNPSKIEVKNSLHGKISKPNQQNHEESLTGLSIIKKGSVNNEKNQNDSLANSEETEETCDYSLLITGDVFDISYQIFRTIQDNGLVYNGRLIVQSNFQTIDENIFGAGKICEFSQRYKSLAMGKSLRMDRYNQTEVGKALASSFVSRFEETQIGEQLQNFNQPIGVSSKLFLGYFVVELEFPYQGKIETEQELKYEVSDLLDTEEMHEYTSLGFDNNGILKRIFYFGKREINLDVFKNLIGLHKSYFNNMFSHQKNGLVNSFVDYINEGWAKAIFHPMFLRFKKLVKKICCLEKKEDELELGENERMLKRLIEENVMDFIVDNKELFEFYYVPAFKKRLV